MSIMNRLMVAGRWGGNQSRLFSGACRCLVENERNRQFFPKSENLGINQKRPANVYHASVRMMIVVMVPDSPIGRDHQVSFIVDPDRARLARRMTDVLRLAGIVSHLGHMGLSAVALWASEWPAVREKRAGFLMLCVHDFDLRGMLSNRAHDCNRIRARRTIRSY